MEGWIALLEKGDIETVSKSWRNIKDTRGMMPDYYFIRTMDEGCAAGKCSDEVMKLARSLYDPMPADY